MDEQDERVKELVELLLSESVPLTRLNKIIDLFQAEWIDLDRFDDELNALPLDDMTVTEMIRAIDFSYTGQSHRELDMILLAIAWQAGRKTFVLTFLDAPKWYE